MCRGTKTKNKTTVRKRLRERREAERQAGPGWKRRDPERREREEVWGCRGCWERKRETKRWAAGRGERPSKLWSSSGVEPHLALAFKGFLSPVPAPSDPPCTKQHYFSALSRVYKGPLHSSTSYKKENCSRDKDKHTLRPGWHKTLSQSVPHLLMWLLLENNLTAYLRYFQEDLVDDPAPWGPF